jgi:hypothetical protein
MNLPEIINNPITLKIGDTEILAKKATLEDLGLFENYRLDLAKKKDNDLAYKTLIFALKLCISKAYPNEVIEDNYIKKMIPLDFIRTLGARDVMIQLGFFEKPVEKKE